MRKPVASITIKSGVKNIHTLNSLSDSEVMEMLDLAEKMQPYRAANKIPPFAPKRNKVTTAFPKGTKDQPIELLIQAFEKSMRTWGTFKSAGKALGLQVTPILGIEQTSMPKGEGPGHHEMMVAGVQGADIVCIRSDAEGHTRYAAEVIAGYHNIVGCEPLHVPVINMGDGCHGHPTQGLLDLLHLKRTFGSLNKVNGETLVMGLIGGVDLSRTGAELLRGSAMFGYQVNLYCQDSQLPPANWLKGANWVHCRNWDRLGECHVLNWIRPQDERAADVISFMRLMRKFRYTRQVARLCRSDVIHTHAQPIKDGFEDLLPVFPGMYELPSMQSIQKQAHGAPDLRMAALCTVWANRFKETVIPQSAPLIVGPIERMSLNAKKRELDAKAKKSGKEKFFKDIDFGTLIDHLLFEDANLLNAWLTLIGIIQIDTRGVKSAIGPLETKREGFYGFKGVEVLEEVILDPRVMAALQWVFDTAVFNVMHDGYFSKYVFPLPKQPWLTPDGVLPCPNPRCISNKCSQARTGLWIDDSNLGICRFCERIFTPQEVRDAIIRRVGSLQAPGQGLV